MVLVVEFDCGLLGRLCAGSAGDGLEDQAVSGSADQYLAN